MVCSSSLSLLSSSQTKRKHQAGPGQSEESERRPSEERGRLVRPQRETGRLQEADPAGPEGGAQRLFYILCSIAT